MSEIIANWTKLILGLIALIVTGGYVYGKISTDEIVKLLGVIGALHMGTSGLAGWIGGPTQNNKIEAKIDQKVEDKVEQKIEEIVQK